MGLQDLGEYSFSSRLNHKGLDTEVTCSICYAALGFVGLSII